MSADRRVSLWIETILREATKLDGHRGVDLMQRCGAACAETSNLLVGAREIRARYSADVTSDTLFEVFKRECYDSPNLRRSDDSIVLVFEQCTCPLVKRGIDDSFLCHCTTGYTKRVFEALFGADVEVELESSILRGNSECRQRIRFRSDG